MSDERPPGDSSDVAVALMQHITDADRAPTIANRVFDRYDDVDRIVATIRNISGDAA